MVFLVHKNMIRILAILLGGGGALWFTPASAASFDCAEARQAHEKLICGDAGLSQQDDTLAAVYQKFLGRVTPQTRKRVIQSQRDWLAYGAGLCTPDGFEPETATACLGSMYEDRIMFLRHGLVQIGPYRFANIGVYEAWKTDEDPTDDQVDGSYPGFGYRNGSYPWIDHPANEETARLNDYTAKGFGGGEKPDDPQDLLSDVDGDSYIFYATPDVVSLGFIDYYYAHGAAHGLHQNTYVNFLMKQGRLLAAEDLFDPGKPWQDALGDLAVKLLEDDARTRGADGDFDRPAARSYATDDTIWSLSEDGITVHFPDYSIGSFADGPRDVLMPWNDLKPYLRADLPFAVPR